MELKFLSVSKNESFARSIVASFVAQIDPTMDELTEIENGRFRSGDKCDYHGYEERKDGWITIHCKILDENVVELTIRDEGVGIQERRFGEKTVIYVKTGIGTLGHGIFDHGKFHR